jgi:plasmid maintenance system antidote protein VapI
MASSHADDFFSLPEQEVEAAEFIAEVGRVYQEAFLRRKSECKLSMQEMATKLGVDRSRIHRCLSGHSNLTLESMAELAWALNAKPKFHLELDHSYEKARANYFLPRSPEASPPNTAAGGNIVQVRPESNQGTATFYTANIEAKVRSNALEHEAARLEQIK